MENTDRERFVEAVISRAGFPYRWGSRGPDTFDCCGLVEWGMEQIGKPFGRDISSATLYDIYHTKKVLEPAAQPGSLWLYSGAGNDNISHVMIMIRRWSCGGGTLIGARGGGPTTLTPTKAWEHRAFVDVIQTDYWHNNLVFIVDPF